MSDHKPRRDCGVDDQLLRATVCKMPRDLVRIYVEPGNWPFDAGATREAIIAGASIWSDVTALGFELTDSLNAADVSLRFARIDGPGSVLAWSEFPCPWRPPVQQQYDTRERWSNAAPPAAGRVSLPITVAHELGHALGLSHGPRGNIMFRSIEDEVVQPGSWDRDQMLSRYPAAPPTNGEPGMNRLITCLLAALPDFLACVLSSQKEADGNGESGPIDAIGQICSNVASRGPRSQ